MHKLGVSSDWEICDIFGFGPDELAIVPRPVASVIFLFPYNEAVRNYKIVYYYIDWSIIICDIILIVFTVWKTQEWWRVEIKG